MNEFDQFAGQVFSTIMDLMGEDAVWHKSNLQKVKGKILFKNPTEPVQIGETEKYEYRPTEVTAEYYKGDFEGLMKAVSEKRPQFMIIKGRKYIVTEVTTKFDGKTYIAHLESYKSEME
ncbi:MAG: hypothetical protein LBB85_09435 [Dysgonamonadaceae bacterium]|jgi:hypothetical protein|nr:hypothetical protein [Dysgonamonadaceae bacterium]